MCEKRLNRKHIVDKLLDSNSLSLLAIYKSVFSLLTSHFSVPCLFNCFCCSVQNFKSVFTNLKRLHQVYDVTPFLEDHPGGDEVMLAATGILSAPLLLHFIIMIIYCEDLMYKTVHISILKTAEKDATEDFEEVGHSNSAKEMMEKYYIGEVEKSTVPSIRKYKPPPRTDLKTDNDTGFGTKILQFLIPLLILGIGFALRYLKKEE
ncbi:hypothetical protein Dsin_025862 [Dipteronia sinensis]|uniref:Cytochrome b5 heme-binding domain-containing protein n=1 Tax=Dipteronia sinensis TaxID=43782 RepID=A0AAE0DXD2_9ROSI|nr:hypothetical protein Dsin_025862 [Dipteronia sinensis]